MNYYDSELHRERTAFSKEKEALVSGLVCVYVYVELSVFIYPIKATPPPPLFHKSYPSSPPFFIPIPLTPTTQLSRQRFDLSRLFSMMVQHRPVPVRDALGVRSRVKKRAF